MQSVTPPVIRRRETEMHAERIPTHWYPYIAGSAFEAPNRQRSVEQSKQRKRTKSNKDSFKDYNIILSYY